MLEFFNQQKNEKSMSNGTSTRGSSRLVSPCDNRLKKDEELKIKSVTETQTPPRKVRRGRLVKKDLIEDDSTDSSRNTTPKKSPKRPKKVQKNLFDSDSESNQPVKTKRTASKKVKKSSDKQKVSPKPVAKKTAGIRVIRKMKPICDSASEISIASSHLTSNFSISESTPVSDKLAGIESQVKKS